jgi:Raf kinase inhibitor-like YbhB/YbcL family protein
VPSADKANDSPWHYAVGERLRANDVPKTGRSRNRYHESFVPLCCKYIGGYPNETLSCSKETRMKSCSKRLLPLLCLITTLASSASFAQQLSSNSQFGLSVTSSTFRNDQTLPLSTIYTSLSNGVNVCTPDGSIGGDISPELSWFPAVPGTRSFAVVAFDVTASFTHWGIYNVAPTATGLPANAGAPGSTFGQQITNDFGLVGFDGPCPPPGLVHQYVFTVYALDTKLRLPSSTTFPANAETLFRALLGHVLASGSITGFYSSTPPQ